MTAIARRLLPDTATVGHDGMLDDRRMLGRGTRRGVRHAAVRLRRGAPASAMPRGRRRVRARAGHLRDQGVPVPGDGAARVRRRPAARRRHRRRTARGAGRRRPGERLHACTATTSPATNSARRSRPRCGTSSSTPSTNSIGSTCSPPPASARRPRVVLRITPGVHAHTHEFIATGQDDSKFGFNLANGDALRGGRSCPALGLASSSSACTATSARTCSRRRRSPRRPR